MSQYAQTVATVLVGELQKEISRQHNDHVCQLTFQDVENCCNEGKNLRGSVFLTSSPNNWQTERKASRA